MPSFHRSVVTLVLLAISALLACDTTSGPGQADRFTILVTVSGDGAGVIAADPGGAVCATGDAPCTIEMDEGTQLTLTATPDDGHVFEGWSGAGCTGSEACIVDVGANATVVAAIDDPDRAAATIGQAGGTLVSQDGDLTLTIPAGALAAEQVITIDRIEESELGAAFDALDNTGGVQYDLGPDGLTFDEPVTVSLISDREVTTTETGLSGSSGIMLTASGDSVFGVDSSRAVVESGADFVRMQGQLSHFSPMVQTAFLGSVTAVVEGVPYELYVDDVVQVTARVTYNEVLLSHLSYNFSSFPGTPFRPSDLALSKGSFPVPLEGDSQVSLAYACHAAGQGSFTLRVGYVLVADTDLSPSPLTNGLEFERPVKCLERPTRTLLVEVFGEGDGTVTSDPAGIECTKLGGTCVLEVPHGTEVTLTATPGESSSFVEWGQAASGTASTVVVTMDGDKTVDATFGPPTVELTVTMEGIGLGTMTSDPAGLTCAKTVLDEAMECSAGFAEGATVYLTSAPEPGTEPGEWTGCDELIEAICKVDMDVPRHITQNYTLNLHTLTVTKSGDGTGTVVSRETAGAGGGIDCGGRCTVEWQVHDVTLIARPDPGSLFTGWSGDCTGSDSTSVVYMDVDHTCDAAFTADPDVEMHTLTVAVDVPSGPGGRVSSTTESAAAGAPAGLDPATASATPAALFGGFPIASASGSGIDCTQAGGTCTLTAPAGTTIRLSAHPEPGSVFFQWFRAGVTDSITGDRLLTLTADTNAIAVFFAEPVVIDSVRVHGGGGVNEARQGGDVVLSVYGEGLIDIDQPFTRLGGVQGTVLLEALDSAHIKFPIGHGASALGPRRLEVDGAGTSDALDGAITVTPIAVSPAGHDAALGSTGAPFRTLAAALAVSAPGDSILLAAGEYPVTGVDGLDVTDRLLRGAGSSATTIRGPGSGTGLVYAGGFDSLAGVTVTGFGTGIDADGTSVIANDVAVRDNSGVGFSGQSLIANGVALTGNGVGFSGLEIRATGGSISNNTTGVRTDSGSVQLTDVVLESNGVAIHATEATVSLTTVQIPSYSDSAAVVLSGGFLNMIDSEIGGGSGWGILALETTLTVENSWVRNNALGGIASGDAPVQLTDSEVTGNGTGLLLFSNLPRLETVGITRSRIADGTGAGIHIYFRNGTVTVEDSWIEGNGGSGIHAEVVGGLILRADSIRDNGGAGVDYDAITGLSVAFGAVTGNAGAGIRIRVTHPDLAGIDFPGVSLHAIELSGNGGFQLSDELPAGSPSPISATDLLWGGITGPAGLHGGPDSQIEGAVSVWRITGAGNEIDFGT